MEKISILIIGTNAVGKSTLARLLIKEAGGISYIKDRCTYCNNGNTVLLGDYSKQRNSVGVDEFGETKCLEQLIKNAERSIIIFEGLKCGTFGMSIQNAIFSTKNQLVVFLHASKEVINERLIKRSGVGIKTKSVLLQQKANLNAAIKYKEIGVPVLHYDTGKISVERVVKEIKKKIKTYGYIL